MGKPFLLPRTIGDCLEPLEMAKVLTMNLEEIL